MTGLNLQQFSEFFGSSDTCLVCFQWSSLQHLVPNLLWWDFMNFLNHSDLVFSYRTGNRKNWNAVFLLMKGCYVRLFGSLNCGSLWNCFAPMFFLFRLTVREWHWLRSTPTICFCLVDTCFICPQYCQAEMKDGRTLFLLSWRGCSSQKSPCNSLQ